MGMDCNIFGIRKVHEAEVERAEKAWLFEMNGQVYSLVEDAVTAELQASPTEVVPSPSSTYLEEGLFNTGGLARAPSSPVPGASAGGDSHYGNGIRGV